MTKITLRVYSTSGPSWQPIKNGKPFNKWVGTIMYSDVERVRFSKRYTETIVGDTKDEVEEKLCNKTMGEFVEVDTRKINKPAIIGGNNANTTR